MDNSLYIGLSRQLTLKRQMDIVANNIANQEDNRDGESYNRSWNCGSEGETRDPTILALRQKQQRNFLTTLLLSQGVPMILGGDELGRTQQGNNNTYCQDSPIAWYNWQMGAESRQLLEFTRSLIKLRLHHPNLSRRHWFQGREIYGSGIHDIGWYNPTGHEITPDQWQDGSAKAICIFLNGEEVISSGVQGHRVIDDSFLLMFNAQPAAQNFRIPHTVIRHGWNLILDTQRVEGFITDRHDYRVEDTVTVADFSIMVLRCQPWLRGKN